MVFFEYSSFGFSQPSVVLLDTKKSEHLCRIPTEHHNKM